MCVCVCDASCFTACPQRIPPPFFPPFPHTNPVLSSVIRCSAAQKRRHVQTMGDVRLPDARGQRARRVVRGTGDGCDGGRGSGPTPPLRRRCPPLTLSCLGRGIPQAAGFGRCPAHVAQLMWHVASCHVSAEACWRDATWPKSGGLRCRVNGLRGSLLMLARPVTRKWQ